MFTNTNGASGFVKIFSLSVRRISRMIRRAGLNKLARLLNKIYRLWHWRGRVNSWARHKLKRINTSVTTSKIIHVLQFLAKWTILTWQRDTMYYMSDTLHFKKMSKYNFENTMEQDIRNTNMWVTWKITRTNHWPASAVFAVCGLLVLWVPFPSGEVNACIKTV